MLPPGERCACKAYQGTPMRLLDLPLSNPPNNGVLCDCIHPAQTNSLIETPARQDGCRNFQAMMVDICEAACSTLPIG